MPMEKTDCPLCEDWRGYANTLPQHLTSGDCPGADSELDDDDDQPAVLADGCGFKTLLKGARVVDREAADHEPCKAVVVEPVPDIAAEDYYVIDKAATVAELNPRYDPADPVAKIAYVNDIRYYVDDWQAVTNLVRAAEKADVPTYPRPVGRLEVDR